MIEKDGWYLVRVKGSHRQYKHPSRRGLVTISGHMNDSIARGSFNSILKQAGLKRMKEAIKFHLEGFKEEKIDIPKPSAKVVSVDVTA